MTNRIYSLRKEMIHKGFDGILVCNPENCFYFSGFTGSSGYLIITQNKTLLLTDFRYIQQGSQETNFEVIKYSKDVFELINEIINANNINTLAIEEDYITYFQYQKLIQKVSVNIKNLGDTVKGLRAIKDFDEIQNIKKAAHLGDKAFSHIVNLIKPGISEKDIAIELEYFLKKNGAESLSFNSVVASGTRSSLPHAQPSSKKIQNGDFIVLDFGCKVNGYCSDMTRTIIVGNASQEQREVYHIVLKAQQKALDFIYKGKIASEVDKIARDYITKEGYSRNFEHSLGHGVGLNVHEEPRLSYANNQELKSGMVVTVEPGIYVENFGGVRIEDMVIINDNRVENIMSSNKELMII